MLQQTTEYFFLGGCNFGLGTVNASVLEWPHKPSYGALGFVATEDAINVESGLLNVVIYHWKKAGAESRSGKLSALSDKRCMVYSSELEKPRNTVPQENAINFTII